MLESLVIKNLALIKEEKIEFKKGLNILLGETGSGKSLIFDAISFALGQTNDKTLLRSGESQMKVDALFTNLTMQTKNLLCEYEIEDDEILISRTLTQEGKSSFKINGEPVVASMVKNLSKTLLDSLVQHESIELLKSKNHLQMLDKFGKDEVVKLRTELEEIYNSKKEIDKKISSLGGDSSERERNKDIYTYQLAEIEKANLKIGEDDEIKERMDLLSNAEKIFDAVSIAEKNLSYDQASALNQINEVISHLNSLENIDVIKDCNSRLVSVRYEIEDIVETLSDTGKEISYDEIEFNKLDSRLDLIKSLKKKYGGTIERVLAFANELREKIDGIDNSEELLNKYTVEQNKILKQLSDKAYELSSLRKKLAKDIEDKIINELKDLGMKNTLFKVMFTEKNVSIDGIDNVEFAFSANKGQELKNLAKTASGGETSRLMLALKNIFSSIDEIDCMLFDEVDSGISGEIGNMVGKKLLGISKEGQVICITHLPQVASLADSFYLVKKESLENETISKINEISEDQAILEIARMIGGDKITEIAKRHAIEMRDRKKIEA